VSLSHKRTDTSPCVSEIRKRRKVVLIAPDTHSCVGEILTVAAVPKGFLPVPGDIPPFAVLPCPAAHPPVCRAEGAGAAGQGGA
jgi:hypothetical protein